jgi:AcrR family transcriptional regulator
MARADGSPSQEPRPAAKAAPARAAPQTKREQSEATVERILDSALALIVTRGFNATTVDDIARKANLTKGAIYFHFENKTAVLMALLDAIEKLILGGLMERLMHAGPTSQDQLVAALHSQGMLAQSKTNYLLLFTLTLLEFNGTGSPIETRVKAIYDAFVQALEKIVRTGKAAGEFRADLDPREMAAVVMALQHGTLMEWYCRSGVLNGSGLVRAARVVLLDGMLRGASAKKSPTK